VIPKIAARIRELRKAAAERANVSIAERMALLDAIVHADPSEVARLVSAPCPSCWPTEKAQATLKTLPLPDVTAPNPACPACRGKHLRMEITPTDQLSAAGRAIFKGVRQRSDGSIHVLLEDRQAASDQLNKMQSVYITKSITAHVNVPALKDMTRDEALDFLESLKPTG
jgi:hypothetical protein